MVLKSLVSSDAIQRPLRPFRSHFQGHQRAIFITCIVQLVYDNIQGIKMTLELPGTNLKLT